MAAMLHRGDTFEVQPTAAGCFGIKIDLLCAIQSTLAAPVLRHNGRFSDGRCSEPAGMVLPLAGGGRLKVDLF